MDNDTELLVKRIAASLAASSAGSPNEAAQVNWAAVDRDIDTLLSRGLPLSQIASQLGEVISEGNSNGSTPGGAEQPIASPVVPGASNAQTKQSDIAGKGSRGWLLGGAALLVLLLAVGLSWLLTQLAISDFRASNQQYEAALNKIPANMTLTLNPASLVAGAQVTTAISVTVESLLGNPVPDGTHVTFKVTPPGAGTVDPQTAATTNGVANATFRPSADSGTTQPVQIEAQAGFGPQRMAAIELMEAPQAQLTTRVEASASEITSTHEITFTFKVENSGNAAASKAQLVVSTVPSNTTYMRTVPPHAGAPPTTNQPVTWNIDAIQPGKTGNYSLVVRVNEGTPDGVISISERGYHIRYADGKEEQGTSVASVNFKSAKPTPEPTFTVPALDPSSTISTTATVTPTIPSVAQITATTETPATGLTIKPAHLFSDADEVESNIVVHQLPVRTPVQLLEADPPQDGFYKVSIRISLSKDLVDVNTSKIVKTGGVVVGDDPNAEPNTLDGDRTLWPRAVDYPIKIIDSTESGLIHAEITGWMLAQSIAPN